MLCFFETGDGLGEGYGMLGQAGSGKLRVSVGQSKLAAKVAKRYFFYQFFFFFIGFFWVPFSSCSSYSLMA